VSNTIVSHFAFRIALPTAMLAVLFYTLLAADREQSTWIAQRDSAHQKAVTNSDIESIPFVLPFQHSARIQDVIGLQWPAFAVAGTIAPAPQMFYSERKPLTPTWAGYVTLALTVGLYWFAIAVWIDRRLIQRKRPIHSRVVRIILTTSFVLTALLFVLFLWQRPPRRLAGRTTGRIWRDSLAGSRFHNPVDRGQRLSAQTSHYSGIMKRKLRPSTVQPRLASHSSA
jgi:hypothetical protein